MYELQTMTNELEIFNIAFGTFIKAARLQKGLTQEEVARQTGFSQSHINRWEKGNRSIDFNEALKLCTILRVDVRDFLDDYVYYCMENA